MKKIFICAVLALFLISASACGKISSIDCETLADVFNSDVAFSETLTRLDNTGAEKYFNINPNNYDELAAYIGTKAVCDEFVIIKTNNVSTVKSKLQDHIDNMRTQYSSYRPAEAAKLDNALIEVYKDAVVLIISPDSTAAEEVYKRYLKK